MRALLTDSFDRYGRYAATRDYRARYLPPAPLRILDVGDPFGTIGELFAEDETLSVDLTTEGDAPRRHSRVIASGVALPLPDRAFDLVSTHDTLEHVAPEDRRPFIRELLRLSRGPVLIVGPFADPRSELAERIVNSSFARTTGRTLQALDEHRARGLPSLEEVLGWLAEEGDVVRAYADGSLDHWIAFWLLKGQLMGEPSLSPLAHEIDAAFNTLLREHDKAPPHYRRALLVGGSGTELDLPPVTETDETEDLHRLEALGSELLEVLPPGQDPTAPDSAIRAWIAAQAHGGPHARVARSIAIALEAGHNARLRERLQLASLELDTVERASRSEVEVLSKIIRSKEKEILRLKDQLSGIRSSLTWRLLRHTANLVGAGADPSSPRGRLHARIRRRISRIARQNDASPAAGSPRLSPLPSGEGSTYERWVASNEPAAEDFEDMRAEVDRFEYKPTISIITPVFNTEERWLRRAIASVREQVYPFWELCLADDGSSAPHIAGVLEELSDLDARIKVLRLPNNSGISIASNKALEIAEGEFVAFLDHDDELSPHALFEVVAKLNEDASIDVIYSDEDKLTEQGQRVDPFFKPDWAPDLLRSFNYITHLCVARRTLVERVGAFVPEMDGAQDYDLILRCTDKGRRIAHIPKVLYHWRKGPESSAASLVAKPYALIAGQRAVKAALERGGHRGNVEVIGQFRYNVRYERRSNPLVSIIIPSRDNYDLLKTCIESIRNKSSYDRYELIIVDNGSVEPRSVGYVEELERECTVIRHAHRFNWSELNNLGVTRASGEVLLFLNDDIEVKESAWIELLLEHAQREEVGAVGAKLLYPDGSIQHAGVVIGVGGVASHVFRHLPAGAVGYAGFTDHIRNYSAVTGACMMTRRVVLDAIGGFDEQLRVAFGDIDFCLRLRDKGYMIVYTPYAVLYHKEGSSRGKLHPLPDEILMRKRWSSLIANGDPMYNPNQTIVALDFGLRI